MSKLLIAMALLACAPAGAASATVPVDVGVGPAALFISGPVYRDQPVHGALKLSVEAIIDRETLERNRGRIPPQYRNLVERTSEVRFSPSIFIPDALYISPKVRNTGLYGVSWRPFGVGLPLTRGTLTTGLDAGVVLTSFLLYSDTLPTTFFLRPGIDLKLESELMFTKSFGLSVGWASGLYVPQAVGHFLDVTPLNQTIWHIGQAFLKVHVRFPYEAHF